MYLSMSLVILLLVLLFGITHGTNNLNLTGAIRKHVPSNLFSYNVAIIRNRDIKDNCGGALITNNSVLTAAACIPRGARVEVVLGASDLFIQDMNQLRVYIRRTQIQFDPQEEIALITLNDGLQLPRYIKPIQLAEYEDDFYTGDTGIITGWDKQTRMSANVVKKIDYENCTKSFSRVEESEMCVVETSRTKEDPYVVHNGMGSPVINPKNKKLVGIVSSYKWGLRSRKLKLFRISSYFDWINFKLQPTKETTATTTERSSTE